MYLNIKQGCCILVLILCFSLHSYSQKLIDSRQTSYYTYIYKISDKEAKTIYADNITVVDASYFHTLVDSFPTDEQYTGKLQKGHYLKTFADKNLQKFAITTMHDFNTYILNNNTDLCIQIFDLDGNPIKNADVRVNKKKITFDKKTQSYLHKKSNKKGLLSVNYNQFTAYYKLSRDYNNSWIKRNTRKLVYGTPIKYVWIPIRYVIHLPIDGVKSISKGWTYGTIGKTKRFFVKLYEKAACIFDDYYCDEDKFRDKHTGYFVFNKAKYMPKDTVKFKAFITTKKGRAIKKPVKVILQTNRKKILLTKLLPYRPGAYEYEFYLHDSLQLMLDRSYRIILELKKNKVYMSDYFKYEDYELSKTNLALRLENNIQYKGKPNYLYIKGTDENDLNIMDARVEVLLSPSSTNKDFNNYTFIPDTLLHIKQELKPTGETKILLSDSTFPKANFDYKIDVRMLNSDNDLISKQLYVPYYHKLNEVKTRENNDSLFIQYLKNGNETTKKISVYAQDNFGNKTKVYSGKTPHRIKINPYDASYIIKSDSIEITEKVSQYSSMVQCLSERTKDSIHIVVQNPRKLPFVYNIYKKNSQKKCGYSDSLSLKKRIRTKQNYFLSIRYIWGGREYEDNYKIPLIDKELNIEVTQPKIVYPGQKTKIEVLVTDADGKPVKGVDLTAFSLTKKFNYSVPSVPYFGKKHKDKSIINNFHIDNTFRTNSNLKLSYGLWKSLAGMDSIEYYKFIYPGNNIYRFEYDAQDSITQFAPFVVSQGRNTPVHVIFVDNKPVFFSWATNIRPYSFRIDSGYHSIELRTASRQIKLDKIYFNPYKKTIISINEDIRNKTASVYKVSSKISSYQKDLFAKYTIPYRNNFGVSYAIIEQGKEIQLLNTRYHRSSNNLLGPITGSLKFSLIDSFSVDFKHEPFFEYEFGPKLLKMRSTNLNNYPSHLYDNNTYNNFTDFVFTKKLIQKRWQDYINQRRYAKALYNYPYATEQGAGRLQIKFEEKTSLKERPLNILIFKHGDNNFLRVYPGNIRNMHDLQPAYYKLIFFYPEAKYHVEDSVYIRSNGLNIYKFEQDKILDKDTFSIFVSNIIEKSIFKENKSLNEKETELKQLKYKHIQTFQNWDGTPITGHVYDESGEPLPGATVAVEGTDYGTVTDFDGFYSIKVPKGYSNLTFNYIGFRNQNKTIDNTVMDVKLIEDELSLEEVVVVGYGVSKKKLYTAASVSTISADELSVSNALSGKVAGVSISTNKTTGNIKIRGIGSISSTKQPLYIIDGQVFTGDITKLDTKTFVSANILKDENAMALYGARAANGVVVFQTKSGTFKPTNVNSKGAELDDDFIRAAGQSKSIRSNFSDYAFWQPSLITDKNGKASFETVFPDDVTSWETFYLAMNEKRQSGQTQDIIKSYKPFMAQIANPRFLIEGDKANAIGKVLNYTSDSIKLKTSLIIDSITIFSKSRYCNTSLIDTLSITPKNDSVLIKYYLETPEGYFDGEERSIPVFKKGVETTAGNFYVLDKDTSIQLNFDKSKGTVHLYAREDVVDIIEDEIKHVTNYRYLCNEQLASKLKAYLAQKNICDFKSKKFKHDKKIKKIIKLIEKRQKDSGLWGWWEGSRPIYWISLHVLEALSQAEQKGYNVNLDYSKIAKKLVWELENSNNPLRSIRILRMLRLSNAQIDYKKYIAKLDTIKQMSLNDLLRITEIKQRCNIEYNIDPLNHYKKTTMFGNVFYSENDNKRCLLDNDIQNTLLAYNILSADSLKHNYLLNKMSNYFIEKRQKGYWQNTYESAQIIETILPRLLKGKSKLSKSNLSLTGSINKDVDQFPFEMKISPTDNIKLTKSGNMPIYFTSYQRYHSYKVHNSNENFKITSNFDNGKHLKLKAGEPVKLITKVTVKKDADFVMINIPIPGGCSYINKNNYYRNEVHREYFKNETSIFCTHLAAGDYSFTIELLPRYTGTYTLNPAKVELMYFPTFNANNEIKRLEIN